MSLYLQNVFNAPVPSDVLIVVPKNGTCGKEFPNSHCNNLICNRLTCFPVPWDSLLMFSAGASVSELGILPNLKNSFYPMFPLENVLYQASTDPTRYLKESR